MNSAFKYNPESVAVHFGVFALLPLITYTGESQPEMRFNHGFCQTC